MGRARKEEQANLKKAAAQQHLDAQIAQDWQQGANTKRASREETAAFKADEAARKRQEKAALLAAEEEALGGKGTIKKNPTAASKKKKKNDLSLLEDALVKGADKTVRKKKEEAAKKAQQQKELEAQAAAKRQEQQETQDPLLANTNAMIGMDHDPNNNAEDVVGRQANRARMEAEGASGLDGALEILQVQGDAVGKGNKPNFKALYAEFEAKTMPQLKEEYPGLRLSQYKEKVFALWKKSPDNPANQQ